MGIGYNEAMACGLRVITTDAAGSSLDLVKDNGYVICVNDVNCLSSAIQSLLNEEKREKLGYNSRKIIRKWTYNESLNSFKMISDYVD